jgi:hypothetical protein
MSQETIAAYAPRCYVVHLLPARDGKLTSIIALCGWMQKPRGKNAEHKWFRGTGAATCQKCLELAAEVVA